MFSIMGVMKNGNAISYELTNEEWTAARNERPLPDLMQFKTLKGNWVRLNMREFLVIEFQYNNGLLNAGPGKLPN
jgi:hypothetical protein